MSNNNNSNRESTIHNDSENNNNIDEYLETVGYYMKDFGTHLRTKSLIDRNDKEERYFVEDSGIKNFYTYAGYNVTDNDLKEKCIVKISFMGGHEFKGYSGSGAKSSNKKLKLHVIFGRQKFWTVESELDLQPKFGDTFYLMPFDPELPNADYNLLLNNHIPLEILLLEYSLLEKSLKLISTIKIEWRIILSENYNGKMSFDEELYAIGNKNNVKIGNLRFDLSIEGPGTYLKDSLVRQQMTTELTQDKEYISKCLSSSEYFFKSWKDKDYNNIDNYKEAKIWAESMYGGEYRPVFELVQAMNPAEVSRQFETPNHCLRFVSLMPQKKPLGEIKSDILIDPRVTLSLGYGTSAEHAVLLCSLLLAFSINSYVAVGYNKIRAYYGVIVVKNDREVQFWDACTGDKVDVKNQNEISSYMVRIMCIFNDNILYAINQKSELMWEVDWTLKSDKWKEFTWIEQGERQDDRLNLVDRLNMSIFPIKPAENMYVAARNYETAIRTWLAKTRAGMKKETTFYPRLEAMISQLLCNYENYQITGYQFGLEELQLSLNRIVTDGYKMKTHPLHLKSCYATEKIIETIESQIELINNIIKLNHNIIKYAVRVKIYNYPENVKSMWILIACIYREN